MNGSALIGLTVIGCGLILLALITPGWFGIDTKSPEDEQNIDVSLSPFYARVCAGLDSSEVCVTVSMAKVISKADNINMGMAVDRYRE